MRGGWIHGLGLVVVLWLSWCHHAEAHEFRPAMLALRAHEGGEVTVRFVPPAVTARGPTSVALRPIPPTPCIERSPEHWSCGSAGLRGTLAMAGLDSNPVDVLVEVRWPDGTQLHARLDLQQPSVALGRGAAVSGWGETLSTYFGLGAEHIAGGFDHLLFVLALLLLGGRVRDHVRTITAFTAGHALTLAMASLYPLAVPGPWVEACIAASIVFAAAEALRDRSHRAQAWTWALGFGLVHGLGFYGALAELGLPSATRGLALVGFNLGVEAGQLAVVLALFALAALGPRSTTRREGLRRALAFATGSVAVAWTLERVVMFWSGLP